jgi:hypothetical protein
VVLFLLSVSATHVVLAFLRLAEQLESVIHATLQR